MQSTPINHAITIADQPTLDELRALSDEGFVAVLNLRREGEPDQPLSPSEEGVEVGAVGLEYLHEGVGGAPLTAEGVESICRFLDEQIEKGKVLVHCRRGARAAAMVLVHMAFQEGWRSHEAVAKGQERGLNVDGNLKVMIELFLAQKSMSE